MTVVVRRLNAITAIPSEKTIAPSFTSERFLPYRERKLIRIFDLQVLGPRDDWKSCPEMLCNLIARCLCIKNYPAMFEILNYMGDIVDEFTSGTDTLPPCKYVEVLITNMVQSRMVRNPK